MAAGVCAPRGEGKCLSRPLGEGEGAGALPAERLPRRTTDGAGTPQWGGPRLHASWQHEGPAPRAWAGSSETRSCHLGRAGLSPGKTGVRSGEGWVNSLQAGTGAVCRPVLAQVLQGGCAGPWATWSPWTAQPGAPGQQPALSLGVRASGVCSEAQVHVSRRGWPLERPALPSEHEGSREVLAGLPRAPPAAGLGPCPCLSGFHTPGHHTPLGLGVFLSIRTQMTVSARRPLFVLCCSFDRDTWRLLGFTSDLLAFVCPARGYSRRQVQSRAVPPPVAPSGFGGHLWALSPHRGAGVYPRGGGEQRASRDGQVGPCEDSWWPELPAGDDTSVDRAWLLRPDTRPRLSWPETQRCGHSLEVAHLPVALCSLGAQPRSFQCQAEL